VDVWSARLTDGGAGDEIQEVLCRTDRAKDSWKDGRWEKGSSTPIGKRSQFEIMPIQASKCSRRAKSGINQPYLFVCGRPSA